MNPNTLTLDTYWALLLRIDHSRAWAVYWTRSGENYRDQCRVIYQNDVESLDKRMRVRTDG